MLVSVGGGGCAGGASITVAVYFYSVSCKPL